MKVLILIYLVTNSINLYSQGATNFYIDPKKTYGGSASEYFESVEYIPLESSRSSLFGAPTFLVVKDSGIVVGDSDTHSIFFFTTNGKFLTKYSLPKETGFFIEGSIDENTIVVNLFPSNDGDGEIRTYSLSGKLVKSEKKHFSNSNIKSLIPLDSGYYAQKELKFIPITKLPLSKPVSLIEVYNGRDSLIRQFLKVDPLNYPFLFAFKGGVSINASPDKKSSFFVIPYDYGLYSLTKDNITKLGQFVFPAANVVPPDILKSRNIKKLDSVGRALAMSMDLIESVNNISYHGSSLLFTLQKKLTLMPEAAEDIIYDPLNFMYDTLSGKAIVFEKIYPDSLTFGLPIMDGFSSISGMNYQYGYIYSSISSLKLFNAMERSKSKNIQYSFVLGQYFKTQNRKSNPVIVKMKLKKL